LKEIENLKGILPKKVLILAGGKGTRIQEETVNIPKPMIQIGEKPIIWHIMKHYSFYGFSEFVICLGYKSDVIKNYFINYHAYSCDFTVNTKEDSIVFHNNHIEDWKVTLVSTGLEAMTGGRIKRAQPYLDKEDLFFATYGDGLSDVNISSLLDFHHQHGKCATLTAVRPAGRFGALGIVGDEINEFREKEDNQESFVNGGFFVFSNKIFDCIDGDSSILERGPMEILSRAGELMAYKHHGFWNPMDTLSDKEALENLWKTGKAPWKTW
jgi:glucose-1-phosphate cytidylyltransferase